MLNKNIDNCSQSKESFYIWYQETEKDHIPHDHVLLLLYNELYPF